MYLKLAGSNIRKNSPVYFPYTLANALIIAMFYILLGIRHMTRKAEYLKNSSTDMMLGFCISVAMLMVFVILFYVNSFVMKQRKKEIGLYCILGMEKRHLAAMMFWETALTAAKGLVVGMFSGAVFSQLVFLIFLKIIKIPSRLTFTVPLAPAGWTCLFFCGIYAILLLYNIVSVMRISIVQILQGAKQGEREPKTKTAIAFFGVLLLAAGYGLALSAKGTLDTIKYFLPAALLVIGATYALFMAGTVAALKWMKKREGFYYKPENFIAVSGMVYRMKQNAAGLATICVLSTAVIVTISSCLSLYAGEEDMLKKRFAAGAYETSYLITEEGQEQKPETLFRALQRQADKTGVTLKEGKGYTQAWFGAVWSDGVLKLSEDSVDNEEKITLLILVSQDDYEKNTGIKLGLKDNEAAVFCKGKLSVKDSLDIEGRSWKVRGTIKDPNLWNETMHLTDNLIAAVMPDEETVLGIRDLYNELYRNDMTGYRYAMYDYFFDVEGSRAEKDAFFADLRETLAEDVEGLMTVDSLDQARESYYEQYGTLLFIGLFLSVVFLTAVCLLVYYKQITEGYDDRERFGIMRKIGMSDKEVRRTIRKQIRQVFFLPLVLAAVHTAAAFPALCRIMRTMGLIHKEIFAVCVCVMIFSFGCIYLVIYGLTSRTYYRLVRGTAGR